MPFTPDTFDSSKSALIASSKTKPPFRQKQKLLCNMVRKLRFLRIAFSCEHALCNAHHLRELTYLAEHEKQAWAKPMLALLLEAKKASESMPENCLPKDSSELESILLRYDGLIQKGLAQNLPSPEAKSKKKKRGRPKQSKAKNLLDRLRDFKDQVLAFLVHPWGPFDNNPGRA